MVAPGTGCRFRGVTRNGVSWCHPLPCDASAAVTDFGKHFVQIQIETKKKDLHRN